MQDLYELERKLVEYGADMKGLKVVPLQSLIKMARLFI